MSQSGPGPLWEGVWEAQERAGSFEINYWDGGFIGKSLLLEEKVAVRKD